ncbi:MAG: extracellular solute-binding protein [Actinobacteria bacterium]|nr:extracellular solute-binding protein [Actinomycetota bacterium]
MGVASTFRDRVSAPGWIRATWVALGFGALLLASSACDGGTDTAQSSSTILRVVMADDWATVPAVVDAVRSFEREHPEVQVQVQGVSFAQVPDVVKTSIAADDPVHVAHWHAFAAAADGIAEPVGDLWEGTLRRNEYIPGAVDDVTWEGQLYGVPLDTNALVLMANPEILDQHGFEPTEEATTFDDIARIARAVTSEDGSVRGIAVPSSTWFAYGWIAANGGEIVEIGDDGSVTFGLDSPETIDALGFLGQLVAEGVAYPPASRNISHDAFELFRAGSTALHASGLWDIATLERAEQGWTPAVLPMPRGREGSSEGTALGGSSLFIPRGVEERELAFEFMVHLTADEHAVRLAKEEGRLPAQRDVFEDPHFEHPAFRTTLQQLEIATPMKLIAFPDAQRAFVEAWEDILTGRATAEEALQRAQGAAVRSLEQS